MIFLYISITIKEEDTDFSFFKCFLFMNALQYMDAYDYRMNLGKLKKEVIIPGLSEPPVRTLRATIPENGSHIFR